MQRVVAVPHRPSLQHVWFMVCMLALGFGVHAHGIFQQAFMTWDDSNYACWGLLQPTFPYLTISFMSAKPASSVTTAAAYLLLGTHPWAPLIVALWMGAVLVAVVVRWTRTAGGDIYAAWLASALLAGSFSLNFYTYSHGPQVAQMLSLASASLCLLLWQRSAWPGWLAACAIASAAAVLYHYLSLYVVAGICGLVLFCPARSSGRTNFQSSKPAWRLWGSPMFFIWLLVPLGLAMMLSMYRASDSGAIHFYYWETLWWQVTELAQSTALDAQYYPRVLLFYEGVAFAAGLAISAVYYVAKRHSYAFVSSAQWAAFLGVPAALVFASSLSGADVRPRALAMLLPGAAVWCALGLRGAWKSAWGGAVRPFRFGFALLALAGVGGCIKGLPLYNNAQPYNTVREFIRERRTRVLIGWSVSTRPHELQFMQAEVPTLERVVWVNTFPQVVEQCNAFPGAVFMVSAPALPPQGVTLRLVAHFDNPAERFVPALLEEGVDRLELFRAGYDLPVTVFASRLHGAATASGLGIQLYDFIGCGE